MDRLQMHKPKDSLDRQPSFSIGAQGYQALKIGIAPPNDRMETFVSFHHAVDDREYAHAFVDAEGTIGLMGFPSGIAVHLRAIADSAGNMVTNNVIERTDGSTEPITARDAIYKAAVYPNGDVVLIQGEMPARVREMLSALADPRTMNSGVGRSYIYKDAAIAQAIKPPAEESLDRIARPRDR